MGIALGVILTVFALAFLIWFWVRTPDNLTDWYCIPVNVVVTILILALWAVLILPLLGVEVFLL